MVRFSAVFFLWICNKRGCLLSPCFPLDLFYCNRNFVSQNWCKKFVNRWRIITRGQINATKDGNFSGNQRCTSHTKRLATRGRQHTLLASARCIGSNCSVRGASSCSACCNATSSGSKGLPVARVGLVRFQRGSGGWLGVGDASEVGWHLNGGWIVEMAAREKEKKNVILGFYVFYHGGPYSFIFFLVGKKF